ncbi:hypothetical protein Y032_0028g1799 [Ancylostoma ceylanicum]|uniref:Uncharacterized protein n=1 Tax=Ancylostoma ceylanicum TaxID=53326 RepID=A0A016UU33_9BILA|nr:hypothetical protein Y032_0028g1799 [Ancylostoma ceylanicum]
MQLLLIFRNDITQVESMFVIKIKTSAISIHILGVSMDLILEAQETIKPSDIQEWKNSKALLLFHTALYWFLTLEHSNFAFIRH